MPGTNFFGYFPKVQYDFAGYNKIVTDILRRVAMRDLSSIVNSTIYYKYIIKDGERPEDIADRYYGDSQYYWIILFANRIVNVYAQWPRTHREFENYLISKYGSIERIADKTNESVIHHYEDDSGNWITKETWMILPDENKINNIITIFDYESKINESKREVYIVKVEYLRQIVSELNEIFAA